jgi:hypothetical protein
VGRAVSPSGAVLQMPSPQFWPAVITAPIVLVGTLLFWNHRRRYAIQDRVPWIGGFTGIVVFLIDIMYIIGNGDGDDYKSCSLPILTVTAICQPLAILTYVLVRLVISSCLLD